MDFLEQDPTQKFDILNYLNDLYMAKMAPQIDIQRAGGFHNIHGENPNAEQEILENNKKRIHIPNARITNFSVGSQQNIEDNNEPEDYIIRDDTSEQGGTGYNEISDETKQKGSISRSNTKEIIKI